MRYLIGLIALAALHGCNKPADACDMFCDQGGQQRSVIELPPQIIEFVQQRQIIELPAPQIEIRQQHPQVRFHNGGCAGNSRSNGFSSRGSHNGFDQNRGFSVRDRFGGGQSGARGRGGDIPIRERVNLRDVLRFNRRNRT